MKYVIQKMSMIMVLLLTLGGFFMLALFIYQSHTFPITEAKFLFSILVLLCLLSSSLFKIIQHSKSDSVETNHSSILDSEIGGNNKTLRPKPSKRKVFLYLVYAALGLILFCTALNTLQERIGSYNEHDPKQALKFVAVRIGFLFCGFVILIDAGFSRPWRKLKNKPK